MPALSFNLDIEAGATFEQPFQAVNGDGTPFVFDAGSLATWQIRARITDEDPLISKHPSISAESVINLVLTAAETATLPKAGVWGLEVAAVGGEPTYRIAQGKVKTSAEVVK